MRRVIRQLVIVGLAGVVLTIAVGIASALFVRVKPCRSERTPWPEVVALHARLAPDDWPPPTKDYAMRIYRGLGFDMRGFFCKIESETLLARFPTEQGREDPLLALVETRSGWPMRSHWSAFFGGHREREKAVIRGHRIGKVGGPIRSTRFLPWGIRPLGFAVNVVFYGATTWLLFVGLPGLVRIVKGRLRGCPNCGAQLADPGASHCPACGTTIVNRL